MKYPLILTLTLEQQAADFFTELRTEYFPKPINYPDGHLNLFHALPADEILIKKTIEHICKRNELTLQVTKYRFLMHSSYLFHIVSLHS